MDGNNRLINRDISWLSFNYRVLEEAKNPKLPLYERIKFLAIHASNLEEYYQVRVAYYRNLIDLPSTNKKEFKADPSEILHHINKIVEEQVIEFEDIYQNIIDELRQNNIHLYQNDDLTPEHNEFVHSYFSTEILPYIQPVLLEMGSVFSFLQTKAVYLTVKIFKKTRTNRMPKRPKEAYAIIKIPTKHVPRFIELPRIGKRFYIIFLDDVIRMHLDKLFPGYFVDSCFSIMLSRNADVLIEDEYTGNVAQKIKKNLSKRKTGIPSRFSYDRDMPKPFLKQLMKIFKLAKDDLVPDSKYLYLSDLFKFPNPISHQLEYPPFQHLRHKQLDGYHSMFDAIKEKDWLLHYPYQSYKYVLNFLNEAAIDPRVVEIKTTQYRVATNSAVVSSLISAARNGKKVTVFVEVKARFDEENNLHFAEEMQKAGIKVISSLPKIKIHAKVALVMRKSSKDNRKMRGYSYIGTGNFNEKTAKLYADDGLFTSNQRIATEIDALFTYLETQSTKIKFNKLLVGQFNLKSEIKRLIDREIKNVEKGLKGYMILKMNGLEEHEMIEKIYEASSKGVEIDLIVRGVNRALPNMTFSRNIRFTRIVDRFLEHSRVFIFYNNGRNETYISSADLMTRNLERRIEVAAPITDERLKQELYDIIILQLADNEQSSYLDIHHTNIRRKPQNNEQSIRSQVMIYDYLKQKTGE